MRTGPPSSLLALTLLSCDSGPPPAEPSPPPSPQAGQLAKAEPEAKSKAWVTPAAAKVQWGEDGEFTLAGTDLEGRVSVFDLQLKVTVFGAPKGTTLSFGDASATGDDSSLALIAPLGPELGQLPPKDGLNFDLETDLQAPLTMRFPDGGGVDVVLEQLKIRGMRSAFEGVAQGGAFDLGEDPPGHATYFEAYLGSTSDRLIVGDAPTLAHVDRVAVSKKLSPRSSSKTCKGQDSGKDKLVMQDWEVTVFERSTAKQIDKKTFPAKDKCPLSWIKGKDAISRPETERVHRWLRKL